MEKIDIHHLDDHFFVTRLRKPDFQRETTHWTPAKVVDLVSCFLRGDLIPAVILWQASSVFFVIDGAHRLSALLAWVLDDYGDGKHSLAFFGGRVPDEQTRIAERTRKMVKSSVGAYGEYVAARKNPDSLLPEMTARFNNLATQFITAQWVPTVDRKAAEDSFFKINQAATPIDPTERQILKARRSASALAARAITRAGTGHQYWSPFQIGEQNRIRELGKLLYETLYEPPIAEGPVKTIDLPIAGKGYNALPFVFDLVNQTNGVSIPTSKNKLDEDDILGVDENGTTTIKYLGKVKRTVDRLAGTAPASLGLHPAVYFYTRSGAFQPAAFLAAAQLAERLTKGAEIGKFIKVRKKFEQFLIDNKHHTSLVVHRYGSGQRSVAPLKAYFEKLINSLEQSANGDLKTALKKDDEYAFLLAPRPRGIRTPQSEGKRFSKNSKSAAAIAQLLESAPTCQICGARIHMKSMHVDHVRRRREGGSGDMRNAQLTHPICNSHKG